MHENINCVIFFFRLWRCAADVVSLYSCSNFINMFECSLTLSLALCLSYTQWIVVVVSFHNTLFFSFVVLLFMETLRIWQYTAHNIYVQRKKFGQVLPECVYSQLWTMSHRREKSIQLQQLRQQRSHGKKKVVFPSLMQKRFRFR